MKSKVRVFSLVKQQVIFRLTTLGRKIQVPTGDGIKLMNNSIVVTPRDGKDYKEYVCHATNSFGSTEYKITLLSPRDNQDDDGKYSSSIFERA